MGRFAPSSMLLTLVLASLALGGCSGAHLPDGGSGSCEFLEDCPVGQRCEAGLCVQATLSPAATGSVPRCSGDSDCGPDAYCLGGACFANGVGPEGGDSLGEQPDGIGPDEAEGSGSEDPPADDSELPGGLGGIGPAAPACNADRFEQNDEAALATIVGDGSYAGLSACDADVDFFRLQLVAGSPLFATITGDPALNIELLSPDGSTVLARSMASPNGARTGIGSILESGGHYLRVRADRVVSDYALDISVGDDQPDGGDGGDGQPGGGGNPGGNGGGDVCVADAFEENDSRRSAAPTDPGMYFDMTLCNGDDDWFEISLQPGEELAASIFFSGLDLAINLDLELYAPSGDLLESSDGFLAIFEEVSAVADQAGAYHLHIFNASLLPEHGDYFLQIDVYPGALAPDPLDDPPVDEEEGGEPWDDPPPDVGDDGLLCEDVCGDEGEWEADGVCDDGGPGSEFGVCAYGSDCTDCGPRSRDGDGAPGDELDAGVDASCEDLYEPNDSELLAPLMQPGSSDDLGICDGDEDWFLISLPVRGALSIGMQPAPDSGDLDMELLNGAFLQVESSTNAGVQAELIAVDAVGEHYLRIYGYEGETGAYSLDLDY